jgi:small subunit ribosomal protein S14
LKKSNKHQSKIKVTNRCIITGRTHAVLRFFKHSRIVLRTKALEGFYPGVFKSS